VDIDNNFPFRELVLFRHKARWNSIAEIIVYAIVVICVCIIDLLCTHAIYLMGFSAFFLKVSASLLVLVLNFLGRRLFVFPEKKTMMLEK